MPYKTHCKRGHELTAENVYLSKQGKRNCKQCVAARRPEPKKNIDAKYGARYGSERWQIENLEAGQSVVFLNRKSESLSGTLSRAGLIEKEFTVRRCLITTSDLETMKATIITRIK